MTRGQAINRIMIASARYDELGAGALVDVLAALDLLELEVPSSDRESLIRRIVWSHVHEDFPAEKAMARIRSLFPETDKP